MVNQAKNFPSVLPSPRYPSYKFYQEGGFRRVCHNFYFYYLFLFISYIQKTFTTTWTYARWHLREVFEGFIFTFTRAMNDILTHEITPKELGIVVNSMASGRHWDRMGSRLYSFNYCDMPLGLTSIKWYLMGLSRRVSPRGWQKVS